MKLSREGMRVIHLALKEKERRIVNSSRGQTPEDLELIRQLMAEFKEMLNARHRRDHARDH